VGRNGVLQFIHRRQQHRIHHRVHLPRPRLAVHIDDLAEHAPEQGVPQLHLGLAGIDQPARFRSTAGFIEKFVIGEVVVVPDTEGERQLVHYRRREFALHHHLLGAASGQQQDQQTGGQPALRAGNH
jgi:hypothetical protein